MGFLSKLFKVVAIVAVVATVGYLVAPELMASIGSGLSSIASGIGEAVASAFSALGGTAEAAEISTALGTATEPVASLAADAAASTAAEGAALGAATEPVASLAEPAIAEAAGSTVPAAQQAAGLPDIAPSATEAAAGPGDGLANAATVQADPNAIVQSAQPQVGMGNNPAYDINANAKDALFARGEVTMPPNSGGMLSNAWDATKSFVKDNPLLASMGFKAGSALLAGDPMQQKMEFEDWLRNRNSQSVAGSYNPVNIRPGTPQLMRPSTGAPVFNRGGMLSRPGG